MRNIPEFIRDNIEETKEWKNEKSQKMLDADRDELFTLKDANVSDNVINYLKFLRNAHKVLRALRKMSTIIHEKEAQ